MFATIKKSNYPEGSYDIHISESGVEKAVIKKTDIADVFKWLDETSKYSAFAYKFQDRS